LIEKKPNKKTPQNTEITIRSTYANAYSDYGQPSGSWQIAKAALSTPRFGSPSSKVMQITHLPPQAALPGSRGFLSVLTLVPAWQFRASSAYPLGRAQLEPQSPPP